MSKWHYVRIPRAWTERAPAPPAGRHRLARLLAAARPAPFVDDAAALRARRVYGPTLTASKTRSIKLGHVNASPDLFWMFPVCKSVIAFTHPPSSSKRAPRHGARPHNRWRSARPTAPAAPPAGKQRGTQQPQSRTPCRGQQRRTAGAQRPRCRRLNIFI